MIIRAQHGNLALNDEFIISYEIIEKPVATTYELNRVNLYQIIANSGNDKKYVVGGYYSMKEAQEELDTIVVSRPQSYYQLKPVKWFSVDNKQPEPSQPCLVKVDDEHVNIMFYHTANMWLKSLKSDTFTRILHARWMPVPEEYNQLYSVK